MVVVHADICRVNEMHIYDVFYHSLITITFVYLFSDQ